MLRANPVSLNAVSYDAVIRALEIIRSGRLPISSSKKSADELDKNNDAIDVINLLFIYYHTKLCLIEKKEASYK